jgi:hypothetical protein
MPIRDLDAHAQSAAVRPLTLAGRDFLIVPVVALVGDRVIHPVNAPTPELVPVAVLSGALHKWAGRPVLEDHPFENGVAMSAAFYPERAFGQIHAARVEAGKLLFDVLLDAARAEQVAPAVVADLLAGRTIDVSVGAFVNLEQRDGIAGGVRYGAVWASLDKPDHVCFGLRGNAGACGISMGCGAPRAAAAANQQQMRSAAAMCDKCDVTKVLPPPSMTNVVRAARGLKPVEELPRQSKRNPLRAAAVRSDSPPAPPSMESVIRAERALRSAT